MIGAVLGGLAGAIVFGAVTGGGTVSRWLLIFIVGGLLGTAFAAIPAIRQWASHSLAASIGIGVLWGLIWWLPGLLFYPWRSIAGFVVWGALTGTLYDLTRRLAASSERSTAR